MPGLDEELEAAFHAMEAGFHVRLIGTFGHDLLCARAEDGATTWLGMKESQAFDQFPVRDGDSTIGVLLRAGDHAGKTVRQAMRPLGEDIMVSADLPITNLIPMLRTDHFRLVLRGGRLDGLVTQSDLLKLPVRMLLFGLVSHLELCMRQLIRVRMPWPHWLDLLPLDSQRKVKGRLAKLAQARFEPDALEVTDFIDAMDVLATLPKLGQEFRARADRIRLLRNDVDHAKTFIESPEDVGNFVDTYEDAHALIREITSLSKAVS